VRFHAIRCANAHGDTTEVVPFQNGWIHAESLVLALQIGGACRGLFIGDGGFDLGVCDGEGAGGCRVPSLDADASQVLSSACVFDSY
jgi:hypothetical protein